MTLFQAPNAKKDDHFGSKVALGNDMLYVTANYCHIHAFQYVPNMLAEDVGFSSSGLLERLNWQKVGLGLQKGKTESFTCYRNGYLSTYGNHVLMGHQETAYIGNLENPKSPKWHEIQPAEIPKEYVLDRFVTTAMTQNVAVVAYELKRANKRKKWPLFLYQVYVYRLQQKSWQQEQQLQLPYRPEGIVVDGNMMIVLQIDRWPKIGNKLTVNVYRYGSERWKKVQELVPALNDKRDIHKGIMALHKDVMVVGTGVSTGDVHTYRQNNNGLWVWEQAIKKGAGSPYDVDKLTVALGDNLIAIGNPDAGFKASGLVELYHYKNGRWSMKQKLGLSMNSGDQRFGCSVAFNGKLLAVGAKQDPKDVYKRTHWEGPGRVFVYDYNAWTQKEMSNLFPPFLRAHDDLEASPLKIRHLKSVSEKKLSFSDFFVDSKKASIKKNTEKPIAYELVKTYKHKSDPSQNIEISIYSQHLNLSASILAAHKKEYDTYGRLVESKNAATTEVREKLMASGGVTLLSLKDESTQKDHIGLRLHRKGEKHSQIFLIGKLGILGVVYPPETTPAALESLMGQLDFGILDRFAYFDHHIKSTD
ncbi:MAG: hypothetical protein AAGB24_04570 [Bacteroidota bacterium]